MNFSTHFARLISLDRRYLVNGRTQVDGLIAIERRAHRALFSDHRWPIGHLRYFLGLEIVIIATWPCERVLPLPLELQPKRIRDSVSLQIPEDLEWMNSLPTITDRVVERSRTRPQEARFFSYMFAKQLERDLQLEEAERSMAQLLKDEDSEEARLLRDLKRGRIL